jgi:hypothetical protein
MFNNNTKKRVILGGVLSLGLFALNLKSAKAYGPCDQDGEKLCGDLGHKETLKNCLHRLQSKTSPECQAFLKSQEGNWQKITASWSKVLDGCKQEINSFCKETLVSSDESGQFKNMKDVQVCLMVQKEKIQKTCKNEMNRHIKEFQPNLNTLE